MSIANQTPAPEEGISALRLEIPDLKSVYTGELAQHGDWIVANILTNSTWPITSQKVRWRGVDIWIMPITKGHYPALAMVVPTGKSRAECEELLMRFVSALSWVEGSGYMVDGLGGGNLPRPSGREKERGFSICDEFDLSYFPDVGDEKAQLALALMREGRGLNHPGYAFLSFYKILETAIPKGCKAHRLDIRVDRQLNGLRHQGVLRWHPCARHYESGGYRHSSVPVRPLRDSAWRAETDCRPGQAG